MRTDTAWLPSNEADGTKPLLLFFPFGYLSHYLRCLVLARALSQWFEPRFAAHALYDEFVRAAGFHTFSCRTINETETLKGIKNFDFSWLNEESLRNTFRDQAAVINHMKPAAVLGDAMPTLRMAAEKTRVPFISLFNGYMSRYYAKGRSLSRTHPFFNLVGQLPPSLRTLVTGCGEAIAMKRVHRPFRKIRASEGLSSCGNYLEELEGDYNLICDLPTLFPQKNLPHNYSIIGPLIYDSARHVQDFSASLDGRKKTIFVSLGSTGDWQSLSWLNAAPFRRYNIVAAGDKAHILQGENVISVDFARASEIMPFADLVICQGGNGTIYQALSYGVPLLCRTAHFEQEWNVAALRSTNLAQSLDGIDDVHALSLIVANWSERKEAPIYHTIRQDIQQSVATGHAAVAQCARAMLSAIEGPGKSTGM